MPRLVLTQKAVAKLTAPDPSGKQVIYWDTATKGFGVVCSGVTNARHYIAQRDVGGKTRRVTLGTVSGLTLQAARQRAEDVLDELRRGIDPKKKDHASCTLQAALDDYIAARHGLRPASVTAYRQIERTLEPWLQLELRAITPAMVEARHRSLAQEIGKVTANMTMRALRIVWNFAAERAPLPPNPVTRLRRQWFPEQRRRGRVPDDQLATFYNAVTALPLRAAADYALLLLFTGMRKKETASLLWTDVDLVGKTITVRAEETKAGRELKLPMSDFVYDMLVKRRAAGSLSPYVFPGSGKRGYFTAHKALERVQKATGMQITAHDLRRTYASVAAPEVNLMMLKLLLNHSVSDDVTFGYVIFTPEQIREAVQLVAEKMERLCGIKPVAGGNVAKLRKKTL